MSNGTGDTARPEVEIYDTTLRDGTQREGLSLSAQDKVRIARHLDALGVAFIEGGWPGSNPKDVAFFERARDLDWENATITAFGSTRRAGIGAEDDPQLRALIAAGTSACTLFGKTWTLHVTEILRTTLEKNLEMIEESIAYLRDQGRRAIFDAEHFFDGYAADPDYAIACLRAALAGGAETVVLCDTNGGSMPWQVLDVVTQVKAELGDARVGIHTHNDGDCAVANSLAALRAGARHVQGTINGYGERCGNANLCSILPDAELKLGLSCLPAGHLRQLHELSHFVAEVANLPPDEHAPYVGRSAFAHKGGVHVSAIRRDASSYQHVDPELVGNECRVVVSELSGRANVLSKAEELGLQVSGTVGSRALEKIKEGEARGFAYEAAEASVALILAREDDDYEPPFVVRDFHAIVGKRYGIEMFAEATMKVAVDDQILLTAGEGNGPVSALDAALRNALAPYYPGVADIHLTDYKVRILDGKAGTGSTTRVLIDSRSPHGAWSTVGASANIIEASVMALVDSFEYGLTLCRRERESLTPATSDPRAEAR